MFIDLMTIFLITWSILSISFQSMCNIGFRAYAFLPFILHHPVCGPDILCDSRLLKPRKETCLSYSSLARCRYPVTFESFLSPIY